MKSIISELKATTRQVININDVASWENLKSVLQRNFADHRDETRLNWDLVSKKEHNNGIPEQFHDRISNILNLLWSYVTKPEAKQKD